mgnify:CR=1 FL=1
MVAHYVLTSGKEGLALFQTYRKDDQLSLDKASATVQVPRSRCPWRLLIQNSYGR